MSQSHCDFLEEVATWDKHTCLDNLDSALPKLIAGLKDSVYIEESIGILKIICQSFLSCVPLEELEDRIFRHICKLTNGFVDSSLSKINVIVNGALKDTPEDARRLVHECLELIMDAVNCVESWIKHVLSVSSSTELSSVLSLPVCAVHILKEVYTHCKISGSLYGDFLENFGEPLTFLFKRTHSLQMSLLNLLDKICITGAQLEEHVQVLDSVCTGLYEVCGIVNSLDVKLVISLWKSIVKVCSQHINLLRDRFDVCPLINFLCDEIKQGCKYLFDLCPAADQDSLSQGDDKAFTKSTKILGFQMKVIVAFLRDFSDYLGNCEKNVLDMLLFLHRFLSPSLCAKDIPAKLESEVRGQVVNATAPILSHLVGSSVFRSCLTGPNQELSSDDRLPQLLIQLMVLDMLPKCEADVIDYWLSPSNHNFTSTRGLLSAIFESVQQCEVEMRTLAMLPGVMFDGKPQRQVSLYEHTATHICGFIGSCPARHFGTLEDTLIENALCDSHLSSLLAVDCWCFLVRYGTASTCRAHVHILVKAFNQLKGTNHIITDRFRFLIKRLIKYMLPEDQSALVKQYAPLEESHLWVALGTLCLNGDIAVSVRQSLISWGLSVLQGATVKALEVMTVCRMFTDIFDNSPLKDCMSHQQQILLVNSICQVWAYLQSTSQEHCPARKGLIARLLHLSKHLLLVLDAGDILMVLTTIQSSFKEVNRSDVAMAACHFLSGFGHLRIAPSFQHQILSRLPQVFYALMTHQDPLVHHRALEAFVQFASHTVYEEAIVACVQGNELLNIRIQQYHNKAPYQSSEKKLLLVEYLRSQVREAVIEGIFDETSSDVNAGETEVGKNNEAQTQGTVDNISDKGEEFEHPAKRVKLLHASPLSLDKKVNSDIISTTRATDSPESSKYLTILEKLSTVASDMKQECRNVSTPPQWFVDAVREALTRIQDSITPKNNWFDSLS